MDQSTISGAAAAVAAAAVDGATESDRDDEFAQAADANEGSVSLHATSRNDVFCRDVSMNWRCNFSISWN
jgi:hypothetical protein